MITESKRLYRMGLAIHWLYPNSKEPIGKKWTKGDRKPWEELEDSYRYGLNVGVRLGRVSKFKDGTYLAVIDCDVKSEDPRHLKEMQAKLKELIGAHTKSAPQVSSGRGNGSRHIYIRTQKPLSPGKFTESPDKVRVSMPSVKRVSRLEKAELKDHEIKAGIRIRSAWEISLMGEGQQVVLPPSLHPDTGDAYEWAVPLEGWKDMPVMSFPEFEARQSEAKTLVVQDFEAVEVDLISSELPDSTVDMILSGDNVMDRSAALFTVCIAMVKARFTDNEILSVLTDKTNFLGAVAYEHAQTTSRKRAASWLARYTLAKVKDEVSAEKAFANEVEEVELTEEQAASQEKKILADKDWRTKIEREGKSERPKPTIKNTITILKNALHPSVFKFDEFALRTSHGVDTPWAKAGAAVKDVDTISVKRWFAEHHRFEPSIPLVWETIAGVADDNKFHPIQEYLKSLPEWDGVPRIDGWLKKHFHAEGPDFYLNEVLTLWLVAAIRRVFEPGAKFDWMLILEGNQDIGKSSFVQILASSKYFIDRLGDLGDKDAAQVLQGIWLVEMGELKELKRSEIETVKGFITRQIDKYRPSYGRASIEAPRQCVFAGSTNAEKYLIDDTGNRRFIPVKLNGMLDFKQLEEDRDHLWAEAYALYRSGMVPNGVLSPESKAHAAKCHEKRMTVDDSHVMAEQILHAMDKAAKDPTGGFNFQRFRMLDLFEGVGPLAEWKASGWYLQLAGRALKKIGARMVKCKGKTWWKMEKVIPPPPPSPHPKRKKKKALKRLE